MSQPHPLKVVAAGKDADQMHRVRRVRLLASPVGGWVHDGYSENGGGIERVEHIE